MYSPGILDFSRAIIFPLFMYGNEIMLPDQASPATDRCITESRETEAMLLLATFRPQGNRTQLICHSWLLIALGNFFSLSILWSPAESPVLTASSSFYHVLYAQRKAPLPLFPRFSIVIIVVEIQIWGKFNCWGEAGTLVEVLPHWISIYIGNSRGAQYLNPREFEYETFGFPRYWGKYRDDRLLLSS